MTWKPLSTVGDPVLIAARCLARQDAGRAAAVGMPVDEEYLAYWHACRLRRRAEVSLELPRSQQVYRVQVVEPTRILYAFALTLGVLIFLAMVVICGG